MILEVKATISAFVIIFVFLVLTFTITVNMFLSVLLFVILGFIVFENIITAYFLLNSHGVKWVDKPPQGHVTAVILTIDGLIDLEWAKVGPHGKREWMYNGKEASIIDKGEYPVHLPNGARGFICHEKAGKSIDPKVVRYAEKLKDTFGTNNVKEMYSLAKEKDKILEVEVVNE